MKCAVAVYHVCKADSLGDGSRLDAILIHLVRVATVDVNCAALSPAEIAAAAWIEAVGRERQARLVELRAPASILRVACDRRTIAAAMREAPPSFIGQDGFIFDNLVESWFVAIDGADALPSPPRRRSGSARPDLEELPPAMRSLWEPTPN
jgi:hypothetical protein